MFLELGLGGGSFEGLGVGWPLRQVLKEGMESKEVGGDL